MENTGVEGEMGEGFQGEIAAGNRAMADGGLFRIGRNQNAGRVSERTMEVKPDEDCGGDDNESSERFQRTLRKQSASREEGAEINR